MEVFLESFFAIDTDNSEEITVDELRAYMNKNDFDEGFVQVESFKHVLGMLNIILCSVFVKKVAQKC